MRAHRTSSCLAMCAGRQDWSMSIMTNTSNTSIRASQASCAGRTSNTTGGSMTLLRECTCALRHTTVLSEVQVHQTVVPATGEKHESDSKTWQEEEVEDAKVDSHLRDAHDVASVSDGPADGVEEPQEVEVPGEDGVVATDREATARGEAVHESRVGKEEVSQRAEGEEAPFVTSGRVSSGKIRDDPSTQYQ